MKNEKIYNMPFGKVYGLLTNKALSKNRTQKEVIELTSWLLGYSEEEINNAYLEENRAPDEITQQSKKIKQKILLPAPLLDKKITPII